MPASSQVVSYDPILLGLAAVVMGLIANSLLEWLRQHLQERREVRIVRRTIGVDIARYLKIVEPVAKKIATIKKGEKFQLVFITEVPTERLGELKTGLLPLKELDVVSKFYLKLMVFCGFCHQYGSFDNDQKSLSHVSFPAETLSFFEDSADDLTKCAHAALAILRPGF